MEDNSHSACSKNFTYNATLIQHIHYSTTNDSIISHDPFPSKRSAKP